MSYSNAIKKELDELKKELQKTQKIIESSPDLDKSLKKHLRK